ncbi:GUN4 domain-containing protein [Dolichospermum circinale CS-1225]|uniref:GUN4 domain-containing protein n=1 Tax=Dolichospermum circinale TaxID=109265 RepID=UPI0004212661|nr:GUN4 domain-containing protein [Dolichospermum circinale]MDB9466351.1 GUN4 domain-containing protein [Dolichospermum circinale CS-539/09]MDB9470077.1 GUN4 domain-containing protein [Dolichospermum circinale CS-539]MDB9521247.1 GUN4 domain-containing protein [Dolichospermum circinale CS-1225]
MYQDYVFICHNSKDKPQVRQINDLLIESGIVRTFYDENSIEPFNRWMEIILNEINHITVFFIFISNNGVGDVQAQEIDYFFSTVLATRPDIKTGLFILADTIDGMINTLENTHKELKQFHRWDCRNKEMSQIYAEIIRFFALERSVSVSESDAINNECVKLRLLLEEQKWREADKATQQIILRTLGRDSFSNLTKSEFSERGLRELLVRIDPWWQSYSKNRFGFSVQRDIFWDIVGYSRQYGGAYYPQNWEKFGDKVGWRKGWIFDRRWKDIQQDIYGQDFSNVPNGHLPTLQYKIFWDNSADIQQYAYTASGSKIPGSLRRVPNSEDFPIVFLI